MNARAKYVMQVHGSHLFFELILEQVLFHVLIYLCSLLYPGEYVNIAQLSSHQAEEVRHTEVVCLSEACNQIMATRNPVRRKRPWDTVLVMILYLLGVTHVF